MQSLRLMNGLRDVLGTQTRVEIMDAINVKSTTEDAKRGTEKMLERHPEINAIATFNEWTSRCAGDADKGRDYGCD